MVGRDGAWDVLLGLGHREQSPPTVNPDTHLSRGSLGKTPVGAVMVGDGPCVEKYFCNSKFAQLISKDGKDLS